jgi:hypothetical protein
MIFSVKKLKDDLEYWIFIGIGDDLIELRDQRLEYAPLIDKWGEPKSVLVALNQELKLPWYKRPTFWHLVRLNIKRTINKATSFFDWKR